MPVNQFVSTLSQQIIAIDSGGAHVLSRLLCEDPSCHLMAIILVNLTFAEVELRNELASPTSSIQLVDALAFTLQLASLSQSDNAVLEPLTYSDENGKFSPRKLLSNLMAEDQKNRPALSNLNYNDGQRQRSINSHFDSKNQLFPETARWCLCAMKNLTRPSKDPIAAHAFIDAGIIPLILKIITVGGAVSAARSRHEHSPYISNSLLAPAEQSLNPDFSPSDLERQNSKGPIE
eukprot:6535303-Ditylum_brightwellii.AAC.1